MLLSSAPKITYFALNYAQLSFKMRMMCAHISIGKTGSARILQWDKQPEGMT